MRPRLRMYRNDVRAGLGERVEERIDRRNHQMDVERFGCVRAKRLHDRWTDRDVGYEVTVHHIDMNPVGARLVDRAHFLAEPGEVGGEDRGGDERLGHGPISGLQPRRTRRAMKKPSSPPCASRTPGRMRTQPSRDDVAKSSRSAGDGGSIVTSACAVRNAEITSSPSCGSSEQTE